MTEKQTIAWKWSGEGCFLAIRVTEVDNLRAVIEDVLSGATCLLIEESDIALSIETRSWEHRSIDKPSAEMVVRGPQEAFNETQKVTLR